MFRYIFSLILIGASLAGFFLFVSPIYKDVTEKREKIVNYNDALTNSKALENIRDELTKKSNSFSVEDVNKLQKLLPDHVDNIRLILEIEKIALPYGMVLKDVEYQTESTEGSEALEEGVLPEETGYQEEVPSGDYNTIELSFSIQGTYSKFVNFIKDLENNLRIVDIVSIDFSASTIEGLNPKLEMVYKYDFKIKTYWLKK